jgi:hypothetical protein
MMVTSLACSGVNRELATTADDPDTAVGWVVEHPTKAISRPAKLTPTQRLVGSV